MPACDATVTAADQFPQPDDYLARNRAFWEGLTGCDPHRWVPETARLLRPGGRLLVLGTTPLSSLCTPTGGLAGDRLMRDYFGMRASRGCLEVRGTSVAAARCDQAALTVSF